MLIVHALRQHFRLHRASQELGIGHKQLGIGSKSVYEIIDVCIIGKSLLNICAQKSVPTIPIRKESEIKE